MVAAHVHDVGRCRSSIWRCYVLDVYVSIVRHILGVVKTPYYWSWLTQ